MKKKINGILLGLIMISLGNTYMSIPLLAADREIQELNQELIINGGFDVDSHGWDQELKVKHDPKQAYSGGYIELDNKEENGIEVLTQSFKTIPGSTLSFEFMHGDYLGNSSSSEEIVACIGPGHLEESNANKLSAKCLKHTAPNNPTANWNSGKMIYKVPAGLNSGQVIFSPNEDEQASLEGEVGNLLDNISVKVIALPEVEISGDTAESSKEEKPLSDQELIKLFNVSASENLKIIVDQSKVDYSKPGTYEVVFSITSSSGDIKTHSAKLTIKDLLPTITADVDQIAINFGEKVTNYLDSYGIVGTEIKTGDLTKAIIIDDSQVNYKESGTYKIVFKVTDEEGNKSEKIVQLVIKDHAELSGNSTASVNEEKELTDQELIKLFNVSESKNLKIIVDQSKVNYNKPGIYEVIFSATSSSGDVATHKGQLTVKDLLPTITIDTDQIALDFGEQLTDYFASYGIVGTEIKTGDLTKAIMIDDSQVNYQVPGSYNIVIKLTDNEGNKTSRTVQLIVKDYAELSGNSTASVNEEKELTDQQLITLFNVSESGNFKIMVDQSKVDYSKPGVYEVIFSATSSSGDVATHKGQLTVKDLLPIITIDTDQIALDFGEQLTDYFASYGIVGTEIKTGDLTKAIMIDDSQVNYQVPGDYNIVLKLTDNEGNETSKTVQLIVKDYADLSGNTVILSEEEKVLTDQQLITLFNVNESGNLKIMVDQSKVDYSKPGVYKVIFSATSSSGNTDMHIGYITITDLLPTITTDVDKIVIDFGEQLTDYFASYGIVGTEVVTGDLTNAVIIDDSQVNYQVAGTYNLIFKVTDQEGNVIEKTVQLVIKDQLKTVEKVIELAKTGTIINFKIIILFGLFLGLSYFNLRRKSNIKK